MAFLSLLFLPVGLMLRQQIPRLIDEVKKLLRQVPLQHIQAGYAHKTIGFGDISVGIDVNGTPSFSASVATVVPYVARAVTVTY